MKIQVNQYFNNRGPAPPICYLLDAIVFKNPEYKSNSMKVKIKKQPGEANIDAVPLYDPVLNTGSSEGLLKLPPFLDNIIKGQSLTTGHKMYVITKNLLAGESL